MNAPPKAKANAIYIDCTSGGESAATALTDGMLSVMATIHTRLEEKHGVNQVAVFYATFLAQFAGFAAAHFGPRDTITLLEVTAAMLRKSASEMERKMAARHGRPH